MRKLFLIKKRADAANIYQHRTLYRSLARDHTYGFVRVFSVEESDSFIWRVKELKKR